MTHEEFAKLHKVGFCKVPENISELPKLQLLGRRFTAPRTIDLRDYCTPTEDQGSKPWCAAYSAAGMAENLLWRKRDYVEQIDPSWIYAYAKTIDGDPNGDGTTLVAVLQALVDHEVFDGDKCKIRVFQDADKLKYAIHKFGCALVAFNVTEEWYDLNVRNTCVTGAALPFRGGHAVLCCGYNPDGVIILNSWGEHWGAYGFALISWKAFNEQFLYGSVLTNALDGLTIS